VRINMRSAHRLLAFLNLHFFISMNADKDSKHDQLSRMQ